MRHVRCDASGIAEAAEAVRDGRVLVYPTDTVYGIGCDPYDARAVERVFRIKRRDAAMALPVLARSAEDVGRIAVLDGDAAKLGSEFWPGGLTLILRLKDTRLGRAMNLGGSVAVRVPGGGCAAEILRECIYVVGTSANVSGEPPASDPQRVRGMQCDLFVDGGPTPGGESTIVDVTGGRTEIVRPGVIPPKEVLGRL